MPRKYPLTQTEEILGRVSALGSEHLKTQESVNKLHTEVAVMREQIKAIRTELKESINESKEFHAVLMERLEALADNKVQIARMQEKVRLLERIVWGTLTVSVGLVITKIADLLGRQ